MDDATNADRQTDIRAAGISRRQLLGIGALGLAGTVLSPAAPRPASAAPGPRILLKHGIVLTLDPAIGDFVRADVLIEDGKIKEVAPQIPGGGGIQLFDASGMIVMPGFVDTHRHMWQGLLRNIGPDDLLGDYVLSILGGPPTSAGFALDLTPDEVYLGDLLAALSAIDSGITTILDWSHINTTPEHTDAVIHALRDSGIRAVYAYGPNFFHPNPAQNPYPNDIFRLRSQYFSSTDQLLTLALAAAGPQFAGVDFAVVEWNTARHPDVDAPITTHVGVGADGPGMVKALDVALKSQGFPGVGSDTTYIHSCTLTDEELDLIRDTGGFFSIATPIEMQMGHGIPPIQKALDRGIPFSLSVDVETNQPTDMFTQMHACFALQRVFKNEEHLFMFADLFDLTELNKHREKLLTVRQVLEVATIGGARVNRLDDKVGTLTPGKDADIIVLDTNQINVAPINNATGAVVLGMNSSNVHSVLIAGKFVKRNHRLVGVNVEHLLRRAQIAHDALMARNGRPPFVV